MIVDAHLDLAANALRGQQLQVPANQQPAIGDLTPAVSFPDLAEGGVGLCCATIYCWPEGPKRSGYTDQPGAARQAIEQAKIYHDWVDQGLIHLVRTPSDLPEHPHQRQVLHAVLLMEGADAMTLAEESSDMSPAAWFERGVRMVGLAWGRTRFSGGTGSPGPLTDDGRRLVPQLDALGIIHDCSHLADEALDELLALATGPVCASHSNCRKLVKDDPRQRHLRDESIAAIARRGGIIGVNLYDRFLLPPEELGTRSVSFLDVVNHMRHVCDVVGDDLHVGIGSDLDGGFGREHIPAEMQTAADLPLLSEALAAGGFGEDAIERIMSGNWLRFLRANLAG